jgi:hypothetical protein
MIVIRRLVDKQRAYTGIFLPGEPAKIFPTSDMEHARILAIYKQERPHEGIINDFSDYALGSDHLPPVFKSSVRPAPTWSPAATSKESIAPEKPSPAQKPAKAGPPPSSHWLSLPGEKT